MKTISTSNKTTLTSSEIFDDDFLSRLGQLHLIAKRLAAGGSSGIRRSRRLGDGLEFADHRDYSPGDDTRFIDWPYYARMEKLLLRLFHEHSEADVGILLDVSDSMQPGGAREKLIYALRATAALAYVSMGSLERVIIQPFSERAHRPMKSSRNRAQIPQVLEYLCSILPGGRTKLAEAADPFAKMCDSAGTFIIISDMLDCCDELSESLARLSSRGRQCVVLHLFSPSDADPDIHGPTLLDESETADKMNLFVTDDILREYRIAWERFVKGLKRTSQSRGAIYVSAPTDLPFDRLILQTLRQAGVIEG